MNSIEKMKNEEENYLSLNNKNNCIFCKDRMIYIKAIFKCHKICNECIFKIYLPKYLEKKKLNNSLDIKILCPLCQTMNIDKQNLNNDINMYNFQNFLYFEKFYFLKNNKNNIIENYCESCQSMQIEAFCYNCEIFYCKNCLLNHNLNKKFKSHGINGNIENYLLNVCRCNKNRKIQYNCLSCDDYFCTNCIILNHFDHNFKADYLKYYEQYDNSQFKFEKNDYNPNFKSKNNIPIENKMMNNKILKNDVENINKCCLFNLEDLKILNNGKDLKIIKKIFNNIKKRSSLYDNFISKSVNNYNSLIIFCQSLINLIDFEKFQSDFIYLFENLFEFQFSKEVFSYHLFTNNFLKQSICSLKKLQKNIFFVNDLSNSYRNLLDGKSHPRIELRNFNSLILEYLQEQIGDFENTYISNLNCWIKSILFKYLNKQKIIDNISNNDLLVFKGQTLRKLKGQTITMSTKMSNDSYPNMFVVFKNNEGRSLLGWINSFKNQIELLDFSEYKIEHYNNSFESITGKMM